MDFHQRPDYSFQDIGQDISGKLLQEWLSNEERLAIQNRVRDLLWIRVIWWNFWSKNHIKKSFLIYDQEETWEKCKEAQIKMAKRKDFWNISEFLSDKGFKLWENERIPTREDVKKLVEEKDLLRAWFISDRYVFDDNGNLWVFEISSDGNIQILDDFSHITYVRVRTIFSDPRETEIYKNSRKK